MLSLITSPSPPLPSPPFPPLLSLSLSPLPSPSLPSLHSSLSPSLPSLPLPSHPPQALDEHYLGVDAQFGGVDQRKIFTFAEKVASTIRVCPHSASHVSPPHLSHPLPSPPPPLPLPSPSPPPPLPHSTCPTWATRSVPIS